MSTSDRIEAFKRLLEGSTKNYFTDVQEPDIREMAEEIEEELTEAYLLPELPPHQLVPTDDEIVTLDLDGSPLSRFIDDKWVFKQLARETVVINFGSNHPGIVDLSDPFAGPLRRIEKLLAYYSLPNKGVHIKVSSPRTILNRMYRFWHLLGYFYNNGYLLTTNGNCKTLKTLDLSVLKTEVRSRISQGLGIQPTVYFAYAVGHWISMSKIAALPEEFQAAFSQREFWGGGLSREVARYEAEASEPWRAIDFDDLLPLISTSNQYIQDYASDLIYIKSKYHEAYALMARSGRYLRSYCISNVGITREIYEAILDHKFALCDKIKNELLFSVVDKKDGDRYFHVRRWINQWEILASAAVFMLFLWTAERRNDLRLHKVNDLIIDGKSLDLNENAIEQVQSGNRFDLWRTVTKTEQDPRGKAHLIPLPKVGALAFAVLVELFRNNRTQTGNPYLLPGGYQKFNRKNQKSNSNPTSGAHISRLFSKICDFVGIEHQHPHKCRKTLATLLINHNPRALELIKDLLCHKSVAMTLMYLMSLPGVAEETQLQMMKNEHDKIIEFMAYAADGKLAGAAGNNTLDAVVVNPEFFKGEALATTVNTLLSALTADCNFRIARTPAAWCLRFPARVPWTAPCLPPNSVDECIRPNPEKCRPWECRHAAHTPNDISRVKSAFAWSKKAASESRSLKVKAHFSQQAKYWQAVMFQLENGRADVVNLHIIDQMVSALGVE